MAKWQFNSDFEPLVTDFIKGCLTKQGIIIIVISAYRSYQEQQQMLDWWNEGPLSRELHGLAFQPAAPGTSYHNFGRAFDFGAEFTPNEMSFYTNLHEKSQIKSIPDPLVIAGKYAEFQGMRWGAVFNDVHHIDDGIVISLQSCQEKFNVDQLVEVEL